MAIAASDAGNIEPFRSTVADGDTEVPGKVVAFMNSRSVHAYSFWLRHLDPPVSSYTLVNLLKYEDKRLETAPLLVCNTERTAHGCFIETTVNLVTEIPNARPSQFRS